jgi:hypothetical protein
LRPVLKPVIMLIRLFVICFILSSCGSGRLMQTSLYFGQSKLDGGTVTEEEWNYFAEKHISKVFPGGSTIVQSAGNWYDTAGRQLVREPSKIVIALYKQSPELNRQIDSLRYWYKYLYHQQSVLRIDSKVQARLF